MKVKKGGYDEPVRIPKADSAALDIALREAVKAGTPWLTAGPASVLGEEVPAGVLTEDAVLQGPPPPVGVYDLLVERLPEAWQGQTTTALGLALALSRGGKTLPSPTVRGATMAPSARVFWSWRLTRAPGRAATAQPRRSVST